MWLDVVVRRLGRRLSLEGFHKFLEVASLVLRVVAEDALGLLVEHPHAVLDADAVLEVNSSGVP